LLAAIFAARAAPDFRRRDVRFWKTDFPQIIRVNFLLRFAMRTNRADKPLRHDRLDGRRDDKRLDAHVNQPRERAGRVVRVERAENQVPGERGADGDFRRLGIADFPDHHDVRVLAQNVAQAHRKRQPDVRAHGDLVDAFQLIFHRLFNRNDAPLH